MCITMYQYRFRYNTRYINTFRSVQVTSHEGDRVEDQNGPEIREPPTSSFRVL